MSEVKKKNTPALDLTDGNPIRLLVLFSIPMFIGALFNLMYNMVDTVILGRFVSAEALASVGAAGSTFMLFNTFSGAVGNATSILVSQAWGAKEEDRIHHIVGQSLITGLAVALAVGFLAVFGAKGLMRLLGTPENIITGSVTYIRIVCGCTFAGLSYNVLSQMLRAIGDSRTPLYFLIFSSILNVFLDLFFVIVLQLAVEGVAIATVISQLTSAILCFGYMWRKYPALRFRRRDLLPDRAYLKAFAGIAVPMTFQSLATSIGDMIITSVINSFGSDIVAAYTVGSKVQNIAVTTFSQTAFSFSVYSGQNFGAKRYDRIRSGMKSAILLIGGAAIFSAVIILLFTRGFISIFIDPAAEPVIAANAITMVRIMACFLPFIGLIWLYNSCLRGVGAIRPSFISGMVELFSKVILSIVLSRLFGATGIWFASPLGWILGILPVAWYYYSKKWLPREAAA